MTTARDPRPARSVRRSVLTIAACVLAATALTGCAQLIGLGYLIGGPPSIEPAFDRETGLSMTAKDIKVAVVVVAPKEVKLMFSDVDKDVAKYLANRMYFKKIQVINPDLVNDWLDKHEDWDTPEELGATFGVDYVVFVELNDFSLYEKHSSELFKGRSDVLVSVWQMDGEQGEQIFSRDVESEYPRLGVRSSYDTKYSTFEREYLEVLSEDIGQLFYEHYHGDDMPNAI